MSTATIQILGSGNAFGHGGRFNTCIYVKSPRANLLLDCGASSIVALRKFGVDISTLDAVIVSHLHGDHFGGIPFLEVACQVEKLRNTPLQIIGPVGIETAVNSVRRIFFPEIESPICEFTEYKAGTFHYTNFELTTQVAVHSKRTNPHSLRITIDDRVIAFSGDTEWHEGLIPLSAGADVFITECSGIESAAAHMTYRQLLQHRHRLTAKRIVLTHMSNPMLGLENCEFERASDGYTIVLG